MDLILDGLSESVRERLAVIWKKRTVAECEATARFAAYATRMKDLGVPQRFQDEAIEASAQEFRHQEVCLETAHLLGCGEIPLETHDFTVRGPAGPANLLADMVDFCCVAETLNVASLASALRDITHPALRRATQKILGDEVKHSRLGWAYLAWARSEGEGDLLAPHIPKMFWGSIDADFFFAEAPSHPDEDLLRTLGDTSFGARRMIFFETVNEVILRGLDAHGISTAPARAWLSNPTWPWRPAAAPLPKIP